MATRAVTLTLPEAAASKVERLLQSGGFETIEEVVDAGLDALDREQAAFDELVRHKVREALDDPRPSLPLDQAFAELRGRIGARRNG